MRHGTLEKRRYTLDDQREFARVSGDWNPLHVDPIAARRTMFGAPLVHGVHLLLWAIDRWLAGTNRRYSLLELRATFRKPAALDSALALEAAAEGDAVRLRVSGGEGECLDAMVRCAEGRVDIEVPERLWEPEHARELSRNEVALARGALELAVDRTTAGTLFPNVLAALGACTLAEILATTRLVGMHCPGLHSIFGGLVLHATTESGRPVLAYEVEKANLKYSMLDVSVRGPQLAGTLSTFYRPTPQAGPTVADVARIVAPGEFSAQRALVIGGSRGLGEALARCLAHGGAEVCITYQRGASDAERIVEETRMAGGRIAAIQLDVTRAIDLEQWPYAEPPTHVYYLATPRIPAVRKLAADELSTMLHFYVTGLYAVVEAVTARTSQELVVWTPSTVFLDTGAGSAAYAIAKAAMEELCRRLPSMLPVVVRCPRLPRIATDQTVGLVQLPARPALDVAVAELRALAN